METGTERGEYLDHVADQVIAGLAVVEHHQTAAMSPNTYEWTYEPETTNFGNAPRGWCLKSGGCAQFFGGQTSSSRYALMWQWSGGGGVSNGVGDFDQIDGARQS